MSGETQTNTTKSQDNSDGIPKSESGNHITTKGHVYRVRGLPLDFDKKRTRDLVSDLLKLENDPSVFQIRSFAEAHDGKTSVATLSFREIPAQLIGTHEWSGDIPDGALILKDPRDECGPPQRRHTFTIDDHFRGLTVLSCPSTEAHKIE